VTDDDIVMTRLRNYSGTTEVNHNGASYTVSPYGTVVVPESAVLSLTKTGGFHIASPDDPSAINSTIEDVAEVVWHLKPGKARSTLLAILASPNSLAHLCQSISFT
jgi:hypothetical protein